MTTIKVADFTRTPGPRFRTEGPHSGEEFRDKVLRPVFEDALRSGEKIIIELDGVRFGYPTSFLEEAFGGLARAYSIEEVLNHLIFHSVEEPPLRTEIERYIRDANKTSRQRGAAG